MGDEELAREDKAALLAEVGVDLRACRAALVRLADDDMILDTAIDELTALREEVARLRAVEAAARAVISAAAELDEAWHQFGATEAQHRALCDALDAWYLSPGAPVRLTDPEPTEKELARARARALAARLRDPAGESGRR